MATIRKRYTFQTLQSSGAAPIAKMTGEGTITFNRAQGHAEKMEYKATLVRSASNVTVTAPVAMEWRRLSPDEVDQMRAEGQAGTRAADAAKPGVGVDTEFAGGPRGASSRIVNEAALLYGVECDFGAWNGEKCVSRIVPLFARDRSSQLPARAVAREGYAVGAAHVHGQSFVLGIQLVFMRLRDDGRLDPNNSYTSDWMGVAGSGKPRTLSGDGDPIIGIHMRRGAVVDALALVVKRGAKAASSSSATNGASPTKEAAANGQGARKHAARDSGGAIGNSLGMKLILVPPGEFSMGSDESADKLNKELQTGQTPSSNFSISVSVGKEDDPLPIPSAFDPPGFPEFAKPKGYAAEQPKHRVQITKPFYLGAYEVTKGQFRKFVESTGYQTDAEKDGKGGWLWEQQAETLVQKPEYNWRSWESDGGEDHPVVNVAWNDAMAFCKWLSGMEGKKYRLPTEAEWEYACRAGTDSRFYNGHDEAALLKIGNVRGFRLELVSETKQKGFTQSRMAPKPKDGYIFTAPVGRFRANRFGLYDMTGNVSEWCADAFDARYYATSPPKDPPGPASGGSRVLRGGGWDSAPVRCRSAFRSGATPTDRFGSIGFRVARED